MNPTERTFHVRRVNVAPHLENPMNTTAERPIDAARTHQATHRNPPGSRLEVTEGKSRRGYTVQDDGTVRNA